MLSRVVVFFVVLMLTGCMTTPLLCSKITTKPPHTIRFATYNVYWQNGKKGKRNPNSTTSIIREINPDILVLQETYRFTVDKLEKEFAKSHPYRLFRHFHREGYLHEEGLGIISRYPIVKYIYFPPIYGWFPGWLYVIKSPKGLIQVLNVHLHPRLIADNNIGIFAEGLWLTPYFRLQEISYYYPYLNPHLPTIIAGDFNENDNGAAGRFLQAHHFRDLLLTTPKNIKTWQSHFGCFNFSGRYDRIYSYDLKSLHCQVLQKGYSDHFPVVLDFAPH